MSEDILVKAQSEIDVFERPSVMTSKELMAEIQKLRLELITSFGETQSALEKLEAAEVENKTVIADLEHDLGCAREKIADLESVIREALEQKPAGYIYGFDLPKLKDDCCVDLFSPSCAEGMTLESLERKVPLYASPVPAMPTQKDES